MEKQGRGAAGAAGGRPERIDPLFSRAFARIFGREESKEVDRALVNAVFAHVGLAPIGEIESIEAEHALPLGSVSCKTPAVDVRIVAEGRLVDLEAQRYGVDVARKALLYGAELLSEGFQAGGELKDMPQVVVIVLRKGKVEFPHAEGFTRVCRLRWEGERGEPLGPATDRMLFVLVELEKVAKRYNGLGEDILADELLAWSYLLADGYADEREVGKMAEAFPTMEEFSKLYGLAAGDPELARAYRAAAHAETEVKSVISYARDQAREQGMAEGRAEGRAGALFELVADGLLAADAAAVRLGMTPEQFAEQARAAGHELA